METDLVDDTELEVLTNKIKVGWHNAFSKQIFCCQVQTYFVVHKLNLFLVAAHKWDGANEKSNVW